MTFYVQKSQRIYLQYQFNKFWEKLNLHEMNIIIIIHKIHDIKFHEKNMLLRKTPIMW